MLAFACALHTDPLDMGWSLPPSVRWLNSRLAVDRKKCLAWHAPRVRAELAYWSHHNWR